MKVAQLLAEEAEEKDLSKMLIVSMLLKLQKANRPLKVYLHNIKTQVKIGGKSQWVPVRDQEWDITKVEILTIHTLPSHETKIVRIHTTSPDRWFELLPEDGENLTIKHNKEEGYFLLTTRDGKGIQL